MVLWVTWRTSEFTSFWEMAVPAWDMQAPCQVVTLVMSWSCTYNNPKNDRTGRCDLTWLYFLRVGRWVCDYICINGCTCPNQREWNVKTDKGSCSNQAVHTPRILSSASNLNIPSWHDMLEDQGSSVTLPVHGGFRCICEDLRLGGQRHVLKFAQSPRCDFDGTSVVNIVNPMIIQLQ